MAGTDASEKFYAAINEGYDALVDAVSDARGTEIRLRIPRSTEIVAAKATQEPTRQAAQPGEAILGKSLHELDRKQATRLRADWEPSADDIAFAERQGFGHADIADIRNRFRDYWIGAPGKAGLKLDWSATWRNKVRSEAKFRRGNGRGSDPIASALGALMSGD